MSSVSVFALTGHRQAAVPVVPEVRRAPPAATRPALSHKNPVRLQQTAQKAPAHQVSQGGGADEWAEF
jgi:hypothetical protein